MHVMKLPDGKYKVTIEAPRDPVTGKRKQITRRHAKRSEAIKRVKEAYNKRLQSMGMHGTDHTYNPTFRVVSEDWIEDYSKRNKITTAINRQHSLNMLYKYFDNIDIRDIKHKMVQNMVDDLSLTKGYSISYCQGVKGAFNLIMKYALTQGIIMYDPGLHVKLNKSPITVDALERQEIYERTIPREILKSILEVTDNDRTFYKKLNEFFRIMYYTGCRPGEVVALKSTDIDKVNKTLSITKTLFSQSDKRNEYLLIPPKDNEKRVITINDHVIDIFEKLSNENKEKEEVFSDIYIKEDFLFCDHVGHPYFTNHISKKFKRAITEGGFTPNNLTPHSLRHTHTTHLIEAGVPVKVIQERLGHSSINTTLSIYAHVTKEMELAASQKIDDHLKSLDDLDTENQS